MTITITLPQATEEWLRSEAAATGKDVGTIIAEAVEARLSLAKMGLRDILAPAHEDLRRSGMTEGELDALLHEALETVRAEHQLARVPLHDHGRL